jgi:hypothetical protein
MVVFSSAMDNVRCGSMLLKSDLKGRIEQLRFKKCGEHATLIQTTFCPDSIVVRSAFATEFFNSIGPTRSFYDVRLMSGWPP